MSDNSRFIDANKIDFKLNFLAGADGDIYLSLDNVQKAIAQTPTEDVIKVIRCNDCKYANQYIKWNRTMSLCCSCNGEIMEVSPAHYCGYGKTKGE